MEIKEALKQREEMLAVSSLFFLMVSLIGVFPLSSRSVEGEAWRILFPTQVSHPKKY